MSEMLQYRHSDFQFRKNKWKIFLKKKKSHGYGQIPCVSKMGSLLPFPVFPVLLEPRIKLFSFLLLQRCHDARDAKLKNLTASISASMVKKKEPGDHFHLAKSINQSRQYPKLLELVSCVFQRGIFWDEFYIYLPLDFQVNSSLEAVVGQGLKFSRLLFLDSLKKTQHLIFLKLSFANP